MEGTESTTRVRAAGKNGNQEVNQVLLMSSKPLHRFVQKEPRSIGIAIVMFGFAELLMGFHLTSETALTSVHIYIPFWQGVLFLVCGNLSIYTEVHPSKKMVTVCLAMYVVSILGIVVSAGFRIYYLCDFSHPGHIAKWDLYRKEQLFGVEAILVTSSLCVSVLLIFLCAIARLALKSTRTQVIHQQILPTLSDTTVS